MLRPLPFTDSSLEAVVGHSFLYLVADRQATLAEAHRVLRPGGQIVLMEPNVRAARVRQVLAASSSAVYGANPAPVKSERDWVRPLNPYAVSKLATEQYACSFAPLYGLETVALRYFNVFGPRQDPTSQYSGVIALFFVLEGSRDERAADGP